MEDSANIELYEEIVCNPAYSSSSDTIASQIQFRSNSKNPDKLNVEKTFSHVLARGPTRE